MSTHKHLDKLCCVVILLALLVTVIFMNGAGLGLQTADHTMGYESRLFDTASVHTIDIVMDDWEGFLEGCTDEEYVLCDLVIDNEACTDVAIRAKGNTSLTQVASYGNDRYSFKVEFDHYDSTKSYYGLDKLCLNNCIQDNTYMKDYLTYQMMAGFGVDAPLCSFVYLTVNGEDWGLYLAVEGVEEAFLERNYGSDYGELYKPDSMSMGGGRGNGADFDLEDWMADREEGAEDSAAPDGQDSLPEMGGDMTPPDMAGGDFSPGALPGGQDGGDFPSADALPEDWDFPSADDLPDGFQAGGGMGGFAMGSDDVSLIYTDDDYDSYSNIFDSAKTDITDADRDRLIASLKQLNAGENIEDVVDVDQVIRYFVVHNFVCNFDSYTGSMIHNYYLYEKDGQLAMIPWDYNLAFGGFQGGGDATSMVNYPIDTPVSGGTVESRPMLAWIFESEEYTALYHQYFAEFLAEYFESGYFTQMMEETYALIAPYVEQDPTKFCTYEEFETGFATLEEFCLLRAESISGQLAGTIPSTDEGQAADSSALIDASALSISDMGSMGAGGGMGGGMERPDRGDAFAPGDWSSGQSQDAAGDGAGPSTASPEGTDETQTPPEEEGGTGGPFGQTGGPMAPGAQGAPPNGEAPQGQTPSQSETPSQGGEAAFQPGGLPQGESGGAQSGSPGERHSGAFSREDTAGTALAAPGDGQTGGESGSLSLGLLALCAGVLAAGLILAAVYRRRR